MAAARLLQALDATDDLDCEAAEAQIPALVDAERAGEDVDRDPAYATLLHHLDRCESCMESYVQLAEAMEALTGETEMQPQVALTPPSFFQPARQSESVTLRVLRGIVRRFELTLAPPRLAPAIATLSGGQRANLFADRLPEVAGDPLVAVTLEAGSQQSIDVSVAIREAAPGKSWQVQLVAGDTQRTATTDAGGVARFAGLAHTSLQEITLLCSELPVEA
jgi:predicted anti-sigma-YlaC factor YlaD